MVPIHKTRHIEWLFAMQFLWVGAVLALPYEHLHLVPISHHALDLLPEAFWAGLLLAVGSMRLAALIINGSAPLGSPIARVLGATIGAAFFSIIAAGFALNYPAGIWAAGIYGLSGIFEAVSIYRATRDLRRAYDAKHHMAYA